MFLRRKPSEEFQIRLAVTGEGFASQGLEFPEGAEAGQERRDGAFATEAGEVVGRERGGVGEEEGRVEFALGDEFGDLVVLGAGSGGEDGARGRLGTEPGGYVRLCARDDVVVGDKVGEDIAVEAEGLAGVEGPGGEAAGGVDGGEGGEGEVGGDGEGVWGVEGGRLGEDGGCEGLEAYARVEFLDLGEGGFGAL